MLICREVADSVASADESGAKKLITLLILVGAGYVIWQEYQKQIAPPLPPTAATVATSDGKAGPGANINELVHTSI